MARALNTLFPLKKETHFSLRKELKYVTETVYKKCAKSVQKSTQKSSFILQILMPIVTRFC